MNTQNPLLPRLIAAKLIRYLGIGAVATSVHYWVFVLMLLQGAPLLGSICGAALGAAASFWLGRKACFIAAQGKTLQPIKFICVALFHNAANALLMGALLQFPLIAPVLAQMLVTASLTLIGFFIHTKWTYHHADLA
jgi:putative flippase GtrA